MLHQDGFKRISRAGHHVWWWACLSCPRWLRINGGRQKQRAQEKWSSNCEDYCFSTSITINITCNLLLLVSFMRTKNEFTFFLWGSSFSRAPANQYFHCGLICGLFFFSNNQLLVWSVKKLRNMSISDPRGPRWHHQMSCFLRNPKITELLKPTDN